MSSVFFNFIISSLAQTFLIKDIYRFLIHVIIKNLLFTSRLSTKREKSPFQSDQHENSTRLPFNRTRRKKSRAVRPLRQSNRTMPSLGNVFIRWKLVQYFLSLLRTESRCQKFVVSGYTIILKSDSFNISIKSEEEMEFRKWLSIH